jgi:FkbM family methyltransferase
MAIENQENIPSVFRDPQGLEILHFAEAETKFVYKEIFEDRIYFRHGITLAKGDCVWDVGANIGLFTLFVQENFEDVQVHAFEPSLQIHEILAANTARYGQRVITHRCGIAGQEREATFTFYPGYSIMSGFHVDSQNDTRTLRAGILGQWRKRYPSRPDPAERRIEEMLHSALNAKQEYVCSLRTISQVIRESGTEKISLLKIDAEGSELDILNGIQDEHWPLIKQVVMEIHDHDESVSPRIVNILESRGFQTLVDRPDGLADSGVVNCYASRL